jgi:hypothetical protein
LGGSAQAGLPPIAVANFYSQSDCAVDAGRTSGKAPLQASASKLFEFRDN